MKKLAIAVVLVGVIVAGYVVAVALRGPMDFPGGKTVELSAYKEANPTGVPAELATADIVKRGEYLALAADCAACHTAEDGQRFAGGRGFPLPYGTLYAPNITPDSETGIGKWNDAEFLRAVHKGIARDGSRLYPAFPYPSYTYLTDEDVLAIKAYLFSLAPVRAPSPENTLRFPYNQRWLMIFWSLIFNAEKRFEPHVDKSAQWNRGAYLAEALAHCGECHTPRSLLQGLNNRRKFAGTAVSGWRAYNITADKASGIGSWSDEEVADYLSMGHAAGRGAASGPMGEAVDLSLRHLTRSDIDAIVAYVRSVPGIAGKDSPRIRAEAAPASHLAGVPEQIDPLGKNVFAGACASCHDWTGVSPLTPTATLVGTRAVHDPSGMNVVQIVINGERHAGVPGASHMPSFGHAYSDTEIAAVANYVLARFGGLTPRIDADDVAELRWQGGSTQAPEN
jgi:mono/diheme cytochrome c family protein